MLTSNSLAILVEVKLITAKVEAINKFPVPSSKKELMQFLEMSGYYRRFCKNFSTIVGPLTTLLHEDKWQDKCQVAFNRVKVMLQTLKSHLNWL